MTNDEMQNAIEFLLKNQANFEVQLEKTNRQLERTSEKIGQVSQQVGEVSQQVGEVNRQVGEASRQVGEASMLVSSLADTQAAFIQTMTRHVEVQGEINASVRREISELAQAQRRTQQDISELTRTVGDLVRAGYKNGNPPQS